MYRSQASVVQSNHGVRCLQLNPPVLGFKHTAIQSQTCSLYHQTTINSKEVPVSLTVQVIHHQVYIYLFIYLILKNFKSHLYINVYKMFCIVFV